MRFWRFGFAAMILFLIGGAAFAQGPSALKNAHAHNDYFHKRPLLDALDQGFCSVEADIFLVEGKLLVAHDRKDIKPERTLQALYLDPLRERARKNRGRIHKDRPEFFLLVDVKEDAAPTYAVLRDVLKSYADILTEFRGETVKQRAVTVVISGARDIETMKAEKIRWAGIDGRMEDLDTDASKTVYPWISDDWTGIFRWRGTGEFPEAEKQKLKAIVDKAHTKGFRVRFWGAPNSEAIWRVQRDAGVDLLNADNLKGMREFLLAAPSSDSTKKP